MLFKCRAITKEQWEDMCLNKAYLLHKTTKSAIEFIEENYNANATYPKFNINIHLKSTDSLLKKIYHKFMWGNTGVFFFKKDANNIIDSKLRALSKKTHKFNGPDDYIIKIDMKNINYKKLKYNYLEDSYILLDGYNGLSDIYYKKVQ